MKLSRNLRVIALSIGLLNLVFPAAFVTAVAAQTQDADIAIQRGYRTGYSDGYMSGYRDTIDGASKNYARHTEYAKADRAYSKSYGTVDDYRDGYQQGFESGYDTGFERRSFESTLPSGLKKRGTIEVGGQVATNTNTQTVGGQTSNSSGTGYSDSDSKPPVVDPVPTSYQSNGNAIIIIPRDTELILELQDDLSTEASKEGEKFIGRIVSPSEIAGAMVEGRISRIVKPGRIKKQSEMSLSFDRIILSDNRWSNFNATLMEVLAVKGDNVKKVDNEGTAIGQNSYKPDAIKVGGATGVGALIGGIAGGPVGIAIGAGVGAAFGVGAVVIERGKHIRLTHNQQLRIKTSYQTQIR